MLEVKNKIKQLLGILSLSICLGVELSDHYLSSKTRTLYLDALTPQPDIVVELSYLIIIYYAKYKLQVVLYELK